LLVHSIVSDFVLCTILCLRSVSFHSSVEARRDIGGEAKFHFLSVVLISLPDFVPMLYLQVYFLFLSFLPILFGFGESLTKKKHLFAV